MEMGVVPGRSARLDFTVIEFDATIRPITNADAQATMPSMDTVYRHRTSLLALPIAFEGAAGHARLIASPHSSAAGHCLPLTGADFAIYQLDASELALRFHCRHALTAALLPRG